VLLAPLITIEPLEDFSAFDQALARLPGFDWLVFTSPRGVDAFIERLKIVGGDLRRLGHLRLAAIGPVTADRLGAFHLRPDIVPDRFQSEELSRALRNEVSGRRVLLARADRGRPVLLDELATAAAHVEQVAVYRNRDISTLPSRVRDQLDAGSIDWVTLTSPAAADRFFGLISATAAGHVHSRTTQIATISPVTSDAVRRHGFEVTLEGRVATWDGIVQALEDAIGRRAGPQME
jgi:uroporphyrinogen III methyltransferase/synthase